MKIKLKQLAESNEALGSLLTTEIPVAISFKIGLIVEELNNNMKHFEESRNVVVKKYGKEQKDGTYLIPNKQIEVADKEMEDLLNTEIEINTEPISIEKLGDIKTKPMDMHFLKWLLTE
jgi:hypothetical protein